jgi:DNA modification methylase
MLTEIINADVMDGLRGLPDASVNTCVTSPPYYGLRDYGVEGQIGLEKTPDEYVAKLVDVFREVRRVLRKDGTLWLNLGDSYASIGRSARKESPGVGAKQEMKPVDRKVKWGSGGGTNFHWSIPAFNMEIKPKDLIGIPWRVAFALQADGWYLRQDIIWHKPNPMPESVTDRCTKAHEYIFLMAKSKSYYFDHEAVKEDSVDPKGSSKRYQSPFFVGEKHESGGYSADGAKHTAGMKVFDGKRNRRSVWSITTRPFKGAHFAVFPPKLVEPCILAGCPVGGTVLDPFGGSGTTAMVAQEHGRNVISIEINPEYCEMQRQRIGRTA